MKLVSKVNEEVTSLACAAMADYHCNRKVYRRIFIVAMIVVMILAMSSMAFASDIDTLGTNIKGVLDKILSSLQAIFTVCVSLFTIAALIMRMTSNQQTAAMATKWLIRVWVCFAIFSAMHIIEKIIQSTVSGVGGTPAPSPEGT